MLSVSHSVHVNISQFASALRNLVHMEGSATGNWSDGYSNDDELANVSYQAEAESWYRYNHFISTGLCVAYGLVFCIGLVGNLLVAFAVLRTKNLRRCVTNVFLVNLAVADLLVILACVPFTLVAHLIYRKSIAT